MDEHEISSESSVDVPRTGSFEMSADQQAAVIALYRDSPKLWTDFRNVIDCMDQYNENPPSYDNIVSILTTLSQTVDKGEQRDMDKVCEFAVVTGFVDQSAAFYRQMLERMGRSYMTDFVYPTASRRDSCMYWIRIYFLNCSLYSAQFSTRLFQIGFLQDIMEDLRHSKHRTADAMETGGMDLSLGTIFNCARHAEVLPLVKGLGLVPDILPFLHKRSRRLIIKSLSYATLSYLVDEGQVDEMLRLDPEILQYFMDNVAKAIETRTRNPENWWADGVLLVFVLLAKGDFNRRIMVSQGITRLLLSALDRSAGRSDEEKQTCLDLLLELATDEDNLFVFKGNATLTSVVKDLQRSSTEESLKEAARKYLERCSHSTNHVPQTDAEEDELMSSMPHLNDLLADQFNMLSILGVSHAQFVLDQLTTTSLPVSEGSDVTRVKSLQALAELAHKDEKYRREIMARGALTQLNSSLQGGSDEERCQTMKVILELVFSIENLAIVKSKTDFVSSLFRMSTRHLDSDQHGETAARLVSVLSQQDTSTKDTQQTSEQ